MATKERYIVEWNGDNYQSVFPSAQSQLSQLHTTIDDAIDYMVNECGIDRAVIEATGTVCDRCGIGIRQSGADHTCGSCGRLV